jgi:NAD(P)-dependent dehydrogenase (short-subunit alcohol dehydrogenase family)
MASQRTIVITGASSGIGRAVALGFAAEGASLLLIARDPDELDTVVEDCRLAGGTPEGFAADVGLQEAVQAAADRAVERFGGIDVWVNNAGVYMIGDVADTPVEDMRRLIETDLLGTVYGSHAAVRCFRRQGHGVLINNSSMLGGMAAPHATAYAAAKSGVNGFTLSLRLELRDEPHIHACLVRPAAIDTPIWRRGANYTGRAMDMLSPAQPPERVAGAIVDLADRPRREVIPGVPARLLDLSHRLAPALVERVFAVRVEHDQFKPGRAAPTSGNLHAPQP